MARKLKVFAADLGFVRAVVAAPSRKAALEAWGVRDDLFARGSAQELPADDPLVAEAQAQPGEVLRKPIAAGADLVAAAKPAARSKPAPASEAKAPAKLGKPAKPPSRDALEAAEASLKAAKAARAETLQTLDAEQAALDRRRAEAETAQSKTVAAAETQRDRARAAYDKALKAWGG